MQFDSDRYELIKHERIEELKSEGYLFRHKLSGARIAILQNDDENKVFSIGFRTPPEDSTGVPHILEHSVLCGSLKYPVKDPFIELAKGSLNTFLNAMTYPDKTVYPVASCNDTDFKNLMDVYLDAVFHPLIDSRKEVFLQEGWHYEMDTTDSPLKYNGVVYNEMKGAYSSPDDVLSRVCMNSLFPDTSYSTESGGDPENIPDLTYEQFVAFHKKLYHPANSYIYIYGNCDMTERLEYLDREYLSDYEYMEVDSAIKEQKPFDKMVRIETEYPVNEEDDNNKSYFSYNIALESSTDKELCMAIDVLDYALLGAPGAPVRQALIDAGLGEDVYGNFEDGIKQPFYSIVAKNVDGDREEEFLKVIKDTLKDLVKNGLNRQTLFAAINSDEFKYREADFGRFPKGLMYGLDMLDTWLYDDDKVFDTLALNDTYKSLRDKINTGYFEKLIEKYFLDNTHASFVVMKPVMGLTEARDKKTALKLEEYKKSLSKDEIERIVKETAELKKYQSEPSTEEELAKIPLLSREDISKDIVPLYNDEKEVNGVKVIHHNIYTNGILYSTLAFNVNSVKDEDIPYLGLLEAVLGYVSTDKYSYDELSNETDIHTGGIIPSFTFYNNIDNPDVYTAVFGVKFKTLIPELGVAYDLISQMVFHAKYDDYKRMKEILAETKARLITKIIQSGHLTALNVCFAQMSETGWISEMTSGIGFYNFISDLYDNFDSRKEMIAKKLYELTDVIFNRDKLIVSVIGDGEEYIQNEKYLSDFINIVPDKKYPAVTRNIKLSKVKKAYKTAAQVNYVARTGNFLKKGFAYDASLKVLKTILSYDFLWNNVRVMGGAYGCMNDFSVNGRGYFVSYRDPNCGKTNETYEKIADYVRNFDASEREMTKYVIGTFSELDIPMSCSTKGIRSFTSYMCGITEELLKKNRLKALETRAEDIRNLAGIVEAVLKDDYLCVIGNSEAISKDADMFDEILNLS